MAFQPKNPLKPTVYWRKFAVKVRTRHHFLSFFLGILDARLKADEESAANHQVSELLSSVYARKIASTTKALDTVNAWAEQGVQSLVTDTPVYDGGNRPAAHTTTNIPFAASCKTAC